MKPPPFCKAKYRFLTGFQGGYVTAEYLSEGFAQMNNFEIQHIDIPIRLQNTLCMDTDRTVIVAN